PGTAASSEDAHFNSIEAILRKLSETVASYSGRLDASNFRLEKVEDVERTLLKQLGGHTGGGEHKGHDEGSANKSSAPSASSEEKDKDIPFEPSHPKIPPYMNTSGRSKYWMHGDSDAAHRVSQKPIHPHTQEDAILSTEEVLALGPDEVAQVLTHDRKLLATVTARLSSGKELADLVFGTDSAELPQGQPTEKALKAILTDPELAKKAINLTMTTLSRGVSKLAAGKTFADEVFGSDTSRLIGEAFHPTEAPEEEVPSAIIPEKAATTAAPGEEKAPTTAAATGGSRVSGAPAVPTKEGAKGETTTEEAGISTTAPEEGMKVFGVDLPSLPVEIPELQLPHVPNPFDLFR
ncbi:fba, partial [Symbiodinium sp. CCMP2592]